MKLTDSQVFNNVIKTPSIIMAGGIGLLILALLPYIDLTLFGGWIFNEDGDEHMQIVLGELGYAWQGPLIGMFSDFGQHVLLPGPWYMQLLALGSAVTGSGPAGMFGFQLVSFLVSALFLGFLLRRYLDLFPTLIALSIYLAFYMNPIGVANSWNGAATPAFALGCLYFLDRALTGRSGINFFLASVFLSMAIQMHLLGFFVIIPLVLALTLVQRKLVNIFSVACGAAIVNVIYLYFEFENGFTNTRAFINNVVAFFSTESISAGSDLDSLLVILKLVLAWEVFESIVVKTAFGTVILVFISIGIYTCVTKYRSLAVTLIGLFLGQFIALFYAGFSGVNSITEYGSFYCSLLISAPVAAFIAIGLYAIFGSSISGYCLSIFLVVSHMYGATKMISLAYETQEATFGLRGSELRFLRQYAESEGITFTAFLKNAKIEPVGEKQGRLLMTSERFSLYSLIDESDKANSRYCYSIRRGVVDNDYDITSFGGSKFVRQDWGLLPSKYRVFMAITRDENERGYCPCNTLGYVQREGVDRQTQLMQPR